MLRSRWTGHCSILPASRLPASIKSLAARKTAGGSDSSIQARRQRRKRREWLYCDGARCTGSLRGADTGNDASVVTNPLIHRLSLSQTEPVKCGPFGGGHGNRVVKMATLDMRGGGQKMPLIWDLGTKPGAVVLVALAMADDTPLSRKNMTGS